MYANIPSALCEIQKNLAFLFTVLKQMGENLAFLSSNVDKLTATSTKLAHSPYRRPNARSRNSPGRDTNESPPLS
ncbi:MAG: hypothetical protein IKD00_02575 [Candidatus Methanomethylophilaceae archaeon]|nr:hypothetical protein [Candidatus Methanomethylophilaceae archaeon]